EIEKAHPEVFNVLLQVLDDGRMTDGQGRTVDFKNTVIVMTSNIGSHEIQRLSSEPGVNNTELIKQAVLDEVKKAFRPEFINRIDEIVVFHGLGQEHIRSIAKIQLRNLEQRLAAHGMALAVTDDALEQIAKTGFDPVYGARPLKRAIQQNIENPIARLVLEGKFGAKDLIPVDYRDGRFAFQRVVH
ncbi:MAG: AAA family ATPase, partial [Quisquiliibacterium sp.]